MTWEVLLVGAVGPALGPEGRVVTRSADESLVTDSETAMIMMKITKRSPWYL